MAGIAPTPLAPASSAALALGAGTAPFIPHRMLRSAHTLVGAVSLTFALSACSKSEATPAGQGGTAATATAARNAGPAATGMSSGLTDSVSAAADRGRIRGSESAAIWLVEVSDFQCPYCKRWHEDAFATIDREYVQTGKVRLAYLNFPLSSIHPNARAAAEAAMCASVQGKFWPLHDALFRAQERWAGMENPMAAFDSLAVAAGVAATPWRACMTSHATAPLIDADRDRSASAGVKSTPTFFVGDRKLEGAYPVDSFRVAIDAAIARARGGR
jgi:protein-disulfide isomerase